MRGGNCALNVYEDDFRSPHGEVAKHELKLLPDVIDYGVQWIAAAAHLVEPYKQNVLVSSTGG